MDREALELVGQVHKGLQGLGQGFSYYRAFWPAYYRIGYLVAALQRMEKTSKLQVLKDLRSLDVHQSTLEHVYQKFYESKGLRVMAAAGQVKYRTIQENARYKPPAEEHDPADELGLPPLTEHLDLGPLVAQLKHQVAGLQDLKVKMYETGAGKQHTDSGPASPRKRFKVSSTAAAASSPPSSSHTHDHVMPPLPPHHHSPGSAAAFSPSAEHPHPHHQHRKRASAAFAFPSAEHHQLPPPPEQSFWSPPPCQPHTAHRAYEHQPLGSYDDDDQHQPSSEYDDHDQHQFPTLPPPPPPPLTQRNEAPAQEQKRKRSSTKNIDVVKEYYEVIPRPNSDDMDELPGFTLKPETMIKRVYNKTMGIPMTSQWMTWHSLDTPIGPFETVDKTLHDKTRYPRVLFLHSTSLEGLKGIVEDRRFHAKVGGDDGLNNRHGYFSTSPEVLFRWARPYNKGKGGKGKRGGDTHQYVVHVVFEVILDPSRGAQYIIYSGCTSDTIKATQEAMDSGIMKAVGYLEVKVPLPEDKAIYDNLQKAYNHVGFKKKDGSWEKYSSKAQLEDAAAEGSLVSNVFRRLLVAPGSHVTRKQLMAFNPGAKKRGVDEGVSDDEEMDIE